MALPFHDLFDESWISAMYASDRILKVPRILTSNFFPGFFSGINCKLSIYT